MVARYTYISLPGPQLGSNGAGKSTRARLNSVASPLRAPSSQPRGEASSTLSGHRLAPAHLGIASSLNPSVLKMGKEVPPGFGIGDIRRQFSDMDKRIRDFSQTISDHIAQSNTPPSPAAESSPLSGNRPVGKPVHEFASLEDYVFFALLSILNTRICEDIFEPFHPAASQENARYGEEYSTMIGTCKLMANWCVRMTLIRKY